LTVCWSVVNPANRLVGVARHAAAEDVQLDLDAEKGLENSIVKVTGDTAALCLDGAGA